MPHEFPAPAALTSPSSSRLPRWRLRTLTGGALALAAVGAVIWLLHSGAAQPAPIRSLAVLPLENLSGDTSQEHFADGMTDELIVGDKDQALIWLDKAFRERFNPSVLLRPGFDPLRADPRFQALERRVGLNR